MAKNVPIVADSLQNVVIDGKTVGFKFKACLANARVLAGRGCFISLVDGFYISVDGEEYPREAQSVEIHGITARSMDEIKIACWEHWDTTEYAWIYVDKEGGLETGEHKITYMPSVLAAYFKAQDYWVENPPALNADFKGPADYKANTFVCTLK